MAEDEVLVTGGTGTLGRPVVEGLVQAGRRVRVLSRHPAARARDGVDFVSGDLRTGEGVTAALEDVGTVVHLASLNRSDLQMTQRILAEASRAGVRHLLYISIVGVDRVQAGYLRSKLASEQAIAAAGIPWTVLRATQFFTLVLAGASRLARLPLVPAPRGFLVQPVDAGEVAGRMVELTLGEPRGRAPDMGGPEVLSFAQVIRTYLEVRGRSRPVLELPVPRIPRIREGGLLVPPGGLLGTKTWGQFLRQHRG